MSVPNDSLMQPGPPSPSARHARGAEEMIRVNMSDPLANKREKARERQRKKRERDRTGGLPPPIPGPPSLPIMHHSPAVNTNMMSTSSAPSHDMIPHNMLSPEDSAKKEKVRLAARERQRKHRAVVKARRMAELGLAMVPANPNDPLGYRVNEDGQMEAVHDANALAQAGAGGSGAYPATPGQTFAHLLMTSASLNQTLKQHLLRTLQMTNEELASFEPIIAAAWDHWNHQRMHYHQGTGPTADSAEQQYDNRPNHENGPTPGDMQSYPQEQSNEYRSRFHKTLTDPTPFQQMSSTSAPTTLPHANPIDPTLATQAVRETSALRNQGAEGHEDGRQEEEQVV